MKVFVKFNIGSREAGVPPLTEGEHEVTEQVGKALLDRKFAELLTAPAIESEIKGVPSKKKADK